MCVSDGCREGIDVCVRGGGGLEAPRCPEAVARLLIKIVLKKLPAGLQPKPDAGFKVRILERGERDDHVENDSKVWRHAVASEVSFSSCRSSSAQCGGAIGSSSVTSGIGGRFWRSFQC